MSHFDAMVEGHLPLPVPKKGKGSEVETQIGKLIAENLVVDGATLQMGKDYIYPTCCLRQNCNLCQKKLLQTPLYRSGIIDQGQESEVTRNLYKD